MDSFAARSHRYSLERRMLHVARGIGVASSKQNHAVTRSFRRRSFSYIHGHHAYLSLLASRSDSSKQRMSSSRTGPLTLRIMLRVVSSMNSTRTWVTPPREPVRPRTLTTLASVRMALLQVKDGHLSVVTQQPHSSSQSHLCRGQEHRPVQARARKWIP